MSQVIIRVDDVSKLYRLGTIGTGHLRQDINRWWQHKVLRKEDSFFKPGAGNNQNESADYIWALKNVSFDVNEGDVYGIIARNGSGKSTLMKYLVQSPQTDVVLHNWAGGRELYVASFYFWVTGTRMQKSQEGLLQSIVYGILSQEPALIPIVLRD